MIKKDNVYFLIVFAGIVLALSLNLKEILEVIGEGLDILHPILLGCIVAFVLNIVVRYWEKVVFPNTKNEKLNKLRRPLCIVLSFISVAFILFLVYLLVIPQLMKSLSIFSDRFPEIYSKFREKALMYSSSFPSLKQKIMASDKTGQEVIQNFISMLTTWTSNLFNIIGSVFGVLANSVMAMIIAIYMVSGKETLGRQFNKLFLKYIPAKFVDRMYYVLRVANSTFAAFFTGQFIEAIILGSLCALGLFVFGFPYAPMIGSVVGMTALIPLVGAYIGGSFGFIMIFTQDPIKAVLFVLFLIILQQIEGNIIYPRVVGGSVGLPGIWVIIAIIIGGGIGGITGVLFGVPIAATLYKLTKNAVNS